MIVYIYNIDVDLYNGFNGLRHRINWTYFTVLDGLAHPLYSNSFEDATCMEWNLDTEQWQETTSEALNDFSNTYSMENFKVIPYKTLSEIK